MHNNYYNNNKIFTQRIIQNPKFQSQNVSIRLPFGNYNSLRSGARTIKIDNNKQNSQPYYQTEVRFSNNNIKQVQRLYPTEDNLISKKNDINFQWLHDPVIPFFLRSNFICKCSNNINCCDFLNDLIPAKHLNQMKLKYQQLKEQSLQCFQTKPSVILKTIKLPDVLIPHIQNLQKIIKLTNRSLLCVASILHHSKSQYLTFWIYCQILAHIPTPQRLISQIDIIFQKYAPNLKQLLRQSTFDFRNFLIQTLQSKCANLIPIEFYGEFIEMILKSKRRLFSSIIFSFFLYLKNGIRLSLKGDLQKYIRCQLMNENLDWQSIFRAVEKLDDKN